ncbi:hypothetical protein [Haloarchaeobius sp. DFWS5]|uniref:hypothetical protein n=1 Tax=Haloarchaeobius sp. DFWS5 TaxID=3446114 RepID=UPI003EBC583B
MRRRQLLTAIGGTAYLAAVGSVGGAVGADDGGYDDTRSFGGGPGFELEAEPKGGTFPEDAEPFARATLGTRESVDFADNTAPRVVRIWNDSDEERRIGFRVRDRSRVRLWQIRSFPANGWLELTVNTPAKYVVAIDVSGAEAAEIGLGAFDCNASTTSIRVDVGGIVSSTSESTLIGCPSSELVDATVTSETGRCGTLEAATVSRENEEVLVDGTVLTPNPCYTARIESVDLRDDRLTVTVGATPASEAACVECVGHVPYQSRMRFENAYPKRVVVDHEVNGRKTRMFDDELD